METPDAIDTPAARPSRPRLSTNVEREMPVRPGRPDVSTAAAADVAPSALPEPLPVPVSPPAQQRYIAVRRTVATWGTVAMRQTILPPCLVLGIACVGLGVGYFLQPADAALRQTPPSVAVGLLVAGGVTLTIGGLLVASLRGRPAD